MEEAPVNYYSPSAMQFLNRKWHYTICNIKFESIISLYGILSRFLFHRNY